MADVIAGCPLVEQTSGGRPLVIGPPRVERMVAVILEPEGAGGYYPVTARPAGRKERRRYRAWIDEAS